MTEKKKKCPKGTRRNKKTGLCEPKPTLRKSKSNSKSKMTIESLLNTYKKHNSKTVIPFVCYKVTYMLMFLYLLQTNKNCCIYNIEKYGLLQASYTNLYMYDNMYSDTKRDSFIMHIRNQYIKCKSAKRILILPFTVGDNIHSNMFILNPYRNEAERFEPHGSQTHIDGFNDTTINRDLERFISDLDVGLKYVPSHKTCPTGYQEYDRKNKRGKGIYNGIEIKDPIGFCCAWSYLYADLRLKFPSMKGSDIVQSSIKSIGTHPAAFREFIRGHIQYIQKMIQKIDSSHTFERFVHLTQKKDKTDKDKQYIKLLKTLWTQYALDGIKRFS